MSPPHSQGSVDQSTDELTTGSSTTPSEMAISAASGGASTHLSATSNTSSPPAPAAAASSPPQQASIDVVAPTTSLATEPVPFFPASVPPYSMPVASVVAQQAPIHAAAALTTPAEATVLPDPSPIPNRVDVSVGGMQLDTIKSLWDVSYHLCMSFLRRPLNAACRAGYQLAYHLRGQHWRLPCRAVFKWSLSHAFQIRARRHGQWGRN